MSCHQRGYPRPSLATPPYRTLLPAGFQGYIPYRHRTAVCRGWLAFARLYEGVHRSTSLMSSFLLLQQCPACLVPSKYHGYKYVCMKRILNQQTIVDMP